MGQERPHDPGIFVRQRDRCHIFVSSRHQLSHPAIRFCFLLGNADHRSCTVDHQGAQVGITTLADAQQVLFAAAGVLFGYQSHPCGQLTAVLELPRITHGRHDRARGDRSQPRYFCQFAARFVRSMPLLYLCFEFFGLPIHFFQILGQARDQVTHRAGQAVFAVFQNFRHLFHDRADSLRYRDAELGEQAPYLVALRRSGFDEALACTPPLATK